jgi:single-stranded-DNA-specific exonuclease
MKKLSPQDIYQILNDRIKDDEFKTLKSLPKPDNFKDMDKATARIVEAIKLRERINLVGDYDVDGIVSTAIMVEFFNAIGVKINYIIPNRFEHGYGLSPLILEQIEDGIIVTVDNGISAIEAADICNQRGLDLIITDHHTVGQDLPKALAIVNPKQSDCPFPFKDICGAQVAWYLCASIKNALEIKYDLIQLFDLLALAIVADIMPMVSLNQTMVKHGLAYLKTSNRASILALRQRYGVENITEEDIGFKFAPLINCAGRMDDPSIALEFLLSSNSFDANEKLDFLFELNEQRKQEQLKMFNEAKLQVDESDDVIVVSSDEWNEGIIGIVASKLCEKYKKPSFVFAIDGEKAKASSRSTPNVHLYNLIDKSSDSLIGFGGHKQAAGLSCETKNIKEFKEKLNQNIKTMEEIQEYRRDFLGDFCISDISPELYTMIESFRPFGQSNPYPIFLFSNLQIVSLSKMGRNKEFTKLIVSNGRVSNEMVVFVDFDESVQVGDSISFLATISKNEFRGEVKYTLLFKEIL